MSRALGLATVAVAALVGGSLLVRLANPFGGPSPSPSDLVPHLWGIGALLVLVLTRSWAPTLAWSASLVGATAAALGAVGLVREVRAAIGDGSVPALDALVVLALVVPVMIAAAYATVDGRRPVAVRTAAWATVLAVAAVLGANFVRRTLGIDNGGMPEWLWLLTVAVLATIGLARDLGPALSRSRARLVAGEARGDRTGGALTAMRVLVDELVPGREAGRAEAVETERGRLAADLHAEVLPSLRRALAEAEAGGTVERLAADLRTAVDEVESLLLSRRSIVLEEIGLLAGVEWLAERVEERSEVRIEIEVGGEEAGAGDADAAGWRGLDAPAPGGRAGRVSRRAARPRQRHPARPRRHGDGRRRGPPGVGPPLGRGRRRRGAGRRGCRGARRPPGHRRHAGRGTGVRGGARGRARARRPGNVNPVHLARLRDSPGRAPGMTPDRLGPTRRRRCGGSPVSAGRCGADRGVCPG